MLGWCELLRILLQQNKNLKKIKNWSLATLTKRDCSLPSKIHQMCFLSLFRCRRYEIEEMTNERCKCSGWWWSSSSNERTSTDVQYDIWMFSGFLPLVLGLLGYHQIGQIGQSAGQQCLKAKWDRSGFPSNSGLGWRQIQRQNLVVSCLQGTPIILATP